MSLSLKKIRLYYARERMIRYYYVIKLHNYMSLEKIANFGYIFMDWNKREKRKRNKKGKGFVGCRTEQATPFFRQKVRRKEAQKQKKMGW